MLNPLYTTTPHGAHQVTLDLDSTKPANRINHIHADNGGMIAILGSELESLCGWWAQEQNRQGAEDDPGEPQCACNREEA
jgi:hypothetical protein